MRVKHEFVLEIGARRRAHESEPAATAETGTRAGQVAMRVVEAARLVAREARPLANGHYAMTGPMHCVLAAAIDAFDRGDGA